MLSHKQTKRESIVNYDSLPEKELKRDYDEIRVTYALTATELIREKSRHLLVWFIMPLYVLVLAVSMFLDKEDIVIKYVTPIIVVMYGFYFKFWEQRLKKCKTDEA